VIKSASPNKMFGNIWTLFDSNNVYNNMSKKAVKKHKAYRLMLAKTALIDLVIRSKGRAEKVDYQYAASIFKREYGLSRSETKELFCEVRNDKSSATDVKTFTRALKRHVRPEKLVKLLEALWLVACANGKIEQSERSTMARITRAIGLTDEHSMKALQRAHRRSQIMQADLFKARLF